MDFTKIFKQKDTQKSAPTAASTSTDAKKTGETYEQWGIRWAGQTNTSDAALSASLNVVVCQLKKEQEEDLKLQQQLQDKINTDICNKENDLAAEKHNLECAEKKLKECEDELSDLTNEKNRVREEGGGQSNKIAKTNLWIGALILLGITIYLVIFYSSASYSAFFKEFGGDTKIYEAMFDAQAWSKSLSEGIPEFLFISLLPFLFMGLGFIIHQFGKREKGWEKYAKVGTLYCITFIFDALLAYEISEKIYNINKGLLDPVYDIPLASKSPGFWIIIFCGFIAYIIWGMVFDFTMQCYEELDEQKMQLKVLEEKIVAKKGEKANIEALIHQLKQNINKITQEINTLKTRIITNSQYDYTAIKRELSNFFNGWVAFMELVKKSNEEMQEAKSIYESFIRTFDATIKKNNDEK